MHLRHGVAELLLAFGGWVWAANVVLVASARRPVTLVPALGGAALALGLAVWPGSSWWWVALPLAIDPGLYALVGVLRRQP